MNRKTVRGIGGTAAVTALLAACSGGGGGGDANTITYRLWDSNQQPAYQQCADAFEAANPDLTIEITQRGWDDYWSTLTTGFVSETAPDVFTNHISKYPEFVGQNQLLALDDLLTIDDSQYADGLAELWIKDGARYGVPKDWDTIALFYNSDMVADAGLTMDQINSLEWNPNDGGTFEAAVAALTVDRNGVRGNEAGFDKNNVDVFGIGLSESGGLNFGQQSWSSFTGSLPWEPLDTNPWGETFNFDDPAFQGAIDWWQSLVDKGYMPTLSATVGAAQQDAFAASKQAINVNGSWMINTYYGYDGVNVGLAPTPVGPSGERSSMFNGLADSVWVGTDNPEGSAKWVEFLGSKECQDIVGEAGVVFPAITTSADIASQAFADRGIDTTAFTVHVDEGTTFLFPITDNGADVTAILNPAMDSVMTGAPASSLTPINGQINNLFN